MSNTNIPSIPEAFRIALENNLGELNICLPGKITKIIDYKKMKISVQPEIKRKYLNGEILEPPIIENVPLKFCGTSKALLHFPIEIDDKVILIFSQRSMDNWLSNGYLSEPGDRRKFNLSDVFAIPGIQAFQNNSLISNNENVYLNTGDYKFTIKNSMEDMAKIMSDFLDEIIAIQTVGSPSQHVLSPNSITNFTAIKTRIGNLLKEV